MNLLSGDIRFVTKKDDICSYPSWSDIFLKRLYFGLLLVLKGRMSYLG